jgi:hypothetical protein
MKLRRAYEKPSERQAGEKSEAVHRYRKMLRKRMERLDYQQKPFRRPSFEDEGALFWGFAQPIELFLML